jgi:hypothetical protein
MEQVLPGIYHWTGPAGTLDVPAHSYYVEPAAALIDPIVPPEGLDAFDALDRPQQVILTSRRHVRDSARFVRAFGALVRAARPAAQAMRGVEPFRWGEEVAPGITTIEIGRVSKDETALQISHAAGAMALGDALVHPPESPIAYASDDMLGKHPDRARMALKDAFGALLARDFDALLFTHGEPIPHHGKTALRRFFEEPTQYAEFGPFGTKP